MAQIQHHDVGDTVRISTTFTVSGTATDPTEVTLKIKDPDGTITTIGPVAGGTGGSGITRNSAGNYHYDLSLDDAGYWFWRWEGTGTAAGAEDGELVVDPSPFYESAQVGDRALVSLAEAKDWLQGQQIDTGEDLELARVINDISDRFHDEAEREFKLMNATADPNPQTRTFLVPELPARDPWYIDGDYMGDLSFGHRMIEVGDMAAAPTTVEIFDTDWTTSLETVASADITVHPTVRGSSDPITALEFHSDVTALKPGMRIVVTGNFGFPAVPGSVRQAVLDAIAETMDRDVEHWRQDLSPVQTGEAANVIVIGSTAARPISMPPRSLAVARKWRNRVPLG